MSVPLTRHRDENPHPSIETTLLSIKMKLKSIFN